MSAAVVFAGPSLAGVPPPPGIELRGPATAGDVYLAARAGARVIGLVDGLFEDRPAPWHMEILWALGQGVRVFGAASLGALRAADCAAFGMEGIGEIHALYASGALEDDHAVALVHAPAELSHAPLTEALVNVRATLAAAAAAGVLSGPAAGHLCALAESLHFKDLTWPRLLAEAGTAGLGGEAAALGAWLPSGRVDLKRRDALALLEAVAAAAAEPGGGQWIAFDFADSRHWRQAVAAFERRSEAPGPGEAAVLDELRLDPARFEREMTRAYARRAARQAVGSEGGPEDRAPEDMEAPDQLLEDLRADLGLATAASFAAWLAEVGARPEALIRAMADEDRLLAAVEAAMPELAGAVLDALRLDGRYERLARRAEAKRQCLAAIREPVLQEAALPGLIEALCARRRLQPASESPEAVARSLGLGDRQALHRLLRREQDYLTLSPADDEEARRP